MKTKIKLLELVSEERGGSKFVKSYEGLFYTNLTDKQIKLVELILSYQVGGQGFFMRYEKIAERINAKNADVIKQYVIQLKKLKVIITDTTSNKVGKNTFRGKKTNMVVDMDVLINMIEEGKKLKEEVKPTPTKVKKEKVIVPTTIVEEVKEELVVPTPEPVVEEVKEELVVPTPEEVEDVITSTPEHLYIDAMIIDKEYKKKTKEYSFNAMEWLKSHIDENLVEFDDDIYLDFILEVEKRYSWEDVMTKKLFKEFIKYDYAKESNVKVISSMIEEALNEKIF